ncbi:PstS family phosphate ABC transporter substrate-binding protein [Wohlfahrtiimonas populi]|uniref:PstS family phosphate ABC transporter substrate-binding protein n=1 Tax=Wohlfahrtiimonas populi TaxID=1940240 RepID=UPI00098D2B8E|nr:substrate-binding domain-containing protein [Wohlfahrtiimonas populi]
METDKEDNKQNELRIDNGSTHIAWKIFVLLILVAAFLFASFLVLIIGSFSGSQIKVYAGFGLTILGIPLVIVSLFMKRYSRKIKIYLWCGFVGILATPVMVEDFYRMYDNSFARVSEKSLEIYDYVPFTENTKSVYLDEPSTLKLTDPLPKLDGARALYPVYAAFAQAVYPQRHYNLHESAVSYNNTIYAYQRLISRKVDMIFVVSPSKEQLEDAKNNNVTMKFTPIGQDAFVFFVNSNNPVNDLTTEQIRDIYSGKIKNWQELGGKNEAIRAFQRNEGSGSQSAFLKFMGNIPIISPPKEDVVQGMGGIINQTADYRNYANSMGFSFCYFVQSMLANNEVKLLSIDGILPSKATIKSGEYPLTASFYAVTLEDNNNPDVEKLLQWILSEQGQKIIEQTGYVPI